MHVFLLQPLVLSQYEKNTVKEIPFSHPVFSRYIEIIVAVAMEPDDNFCVWLDLIGCPKRSAYQRAYNNIFVFFKILDNAFNGKNKWLYYVTQN